MLQPHFEVLPPPQKRLWPELAGVPDYFVLYGGTALGLRLGHRQSVDFDFFTSNTVVPEQLLHTIPFLNQAKILQNTGQTLTVSVNRNGPVKVSFFGGLQLGRVAAYDRTPDDVVYVASLLDLAGTKAAVITQRAEAKDYIDLLALIQAGVTLPQAMAAAYAIYGEQYNPMLTVKSLTYFLDGDLPSLSPEQQRQCRRIAEAHKFADPLPVIPRQADRLNNGDPPA